MLEGGGYEVVDLGVNVAPDKFISMLKEKNANVLAMSTLLTTTMPSMKATIDAMNSAGVRQQAKVIVGGAPVTSQFAREIGADGYAENAAGVCKVAAELTGK